MKITFREIEKEDCELLYKWVNDDAVRSNSFNAGAIQLEEHRHWFEKKLNAKDCLIYIVLDEGMPVGQIRLELEEHIGVIDYSVDRAHRGKGYGTVILQELTGVAVGLPVKKLIGRVKYENLPSRKAFEKAGFFRFDKETYIEYVFDFQ